jgi:hypothetical protein
MRRKHAFVAALLTVAPIVAAAQSSQSRTAWLDLGGQLRGRAEGYTGGAFKPDNSDAYVLTRVLLNARIHTSRATYFFVEGMDSRGPWKNKVPAGPPFRDHADLRQLYFQAGLDKDPQMIRGGRLELAFGDGRLVGSLPWANTPRSFDGARAMFSRPGYRVDAFAASVVKIDQDRFDRNIPGNNFYGVYSSLTKLAPRANVEPFFFWRRQSGLKTELGVPSTMNFGTVGLHAFVRMLHNFDYDTQMAAQSGSVGDESIRAWAGHWLAGFTFASKMLTPRVFAEYNQASGDAKPTDNKKETFDQLYPTGHDKYGLTDLVGWQNMKHVRGGLELAVAKGWSAATRYNSYWLADAHDALYNGGGAILARSPTGTAGSFVGQEIDLIVSGKFPQKINLSAGLGRFVPGTFLKNTTPGRTFTYPYVMLTHDF